MRNKTAIVTGGNSGLGYATAKKFCDNGYTTYIVGRNQEKTAKACEEIGELAKPIVFDLDQLDKIPEMISQIAETEGHIDVLVNNAGINMKKEFIEVTDEEFDKIIHTNMKSVFSISREVVKVMKNSGGGNIVNISSMAAQYGIPKVIAYTASKTAIEGMTRSMAVDLAQYGVRVNCVAPGFIKTPMTAEALNSDPERKNKVFSRTPMGKMGEPEDIADAVFFFASNEAKFVTGVTMCVDGGNSIGF
ncbi:SDR family oxidoreductase [Winogradskyella sp. SYSU M77433]|uniref:SDR family NAD(P)-dependent oxidoreductase n=1 Tax=Winogradskyella sp. SYSU M77433 TaxID=3042722 RepID=UPI0024815E73|nr:SDR family oxidoreductase [Winogradskyella sp. SYSU M77433]MDH7911723.1 SDR family oxidoreductase [Winogradskyella sp. SYSU M77433]